MTFFSPKRKISDAENKLRVLYCLDALGMATQEQLWPFIAQLELMEYIPFCLFVDELKSDGAVAAGTHALEGMLYLTAAGRQQLSLFDSRLLSAEKERILAVAPAYRGQLHTRRQMRAAYEASMDGVYRASLTVREGDVPTLFLRISTARQALVEKAVKGFQSIVPALLNQLYTLPFEPTQGDIPAPIPQEAAISCTSPAHPQLCAFGGHEHAAVVCVEEGDVSYLLMLLLPTAEQAWGWAQAADTSAHALAACITRTVEDAEA